MEERRGRQKFLLDCMLQKVGGVELSRFRSVLLLRVESFQEYFFPKQRFHHTNATMNTF